MTKSIYSPEMIAVRSWLRSERLRLGLTMRELAQKLDRPHSFVQRIEEGDRRLDVVEFVWYCQALGLNPQDGIDLIHQVQSLSE
ncbi:helix-turn-helix domain-containing protein [Moraxella sp. FZLJ2107]|uniref:helix-turn-helix domain-containing protein n=1 Tax=unclassified Moraxella TaxID=2685852 RepID=UPI00209C6AC2|nr:MULTISPECIES: helix-turn-helix transcriptional regulator [unclassified Moraxella]USZ14303.1 helix-turn-helix domain-containing protein [Moraxella sp. FZFQ2102]UTO04974.1 helix-turn-helix domain-containing protein [Moraxella sp. FZLJ2107]UTO21708.1 helix-turn-helix domain-containing protein [Moraxella sp. FZLJ2109]